MRRDFIGRKIFEKREICPETMYAPGFVWIVYDISEKKTMSQE